MKELTASPTNHHMLAQYDDLFGLDDWVLEERTGLRRIRARLIGMGSSRRDDHNHAHGILASTSRCAACRWSEIYVFETVGEPDTRHFCVYTLGPSTLPGEVTRSNVRWASSGFEVVELATVRRGERGAPFLPAAHSRALAMAAEVDDAVAEAYINRAVA